MPEIEFAIPPWRESAAISPEVIARAQPVAISRERRDFNV